MIFTTLKKEIIREHIETMKRSTKRINSHQYESIDDFSDWSVSRSLWNIDDNGMAMCLDECVYVHEDHLAWQMSYHNKNIYVAFSRRKRQTDR
jgi:hypothetical protein